MMCLLQNQSTVPVMMLYNRKKKKVLELRPVFPWLNMRYGHWEVKNFEQKFEGKMYKSVIKIWFYPKVVFFFLLNIRITTRVRYSDYSHCMDYATEKQKWWDCSMTFSSWVSRPWFDSDILSLSLTLDRAYEIQ